MAKIAHKSNFQNGCFILSFTMFSEHQLLVSRCPQDGSRWPPTSQNSPQAGQNGANWAKMNQDGANWTKMNQDCSEITPRSTRVAQDGPDMAQDGARRLSLVLPSFCQCFALVSSLLCLRCALVLLLLCLRFALVLLLLCLSYPNGGASLGYKAFKNNYETPPSSWSFFERALAYWPSFCLFAEEKQGKSLQRPSK